MRAKKNTASPRHTFQTTVTASSPCHELAHEEMTGMAASVSWALSIVNSAPLKNVPTAVPNSIGPNTPLSHKNT